MAPISESLKCKMNYFLFFVSSVAALMSANLSKIIKQILASCPALIRVPS